MHESAASWNDPWDDQAEAIASLAVDSPPRLIHEMVLTLMAATPDAEVADLVSLAQRLSKLAQVEAALLLLDRALARCPEETDAHEQLMGVLQKVEGQRYDRPRGIGPEPWRPIYLDPPREAVNPAGLPGSYKDA